MISVKGFIWVGVLLYIYTKRKKYYLLQLTLEKCLKKIVIFNNNAWLAYHAAESARQMGGGGIFFLWPPDSILG